MIAPPPPAASGAAAKLEDVRFGFEHLHQRVLSLERTDLHQRVLTLERTVMGLQHVLTMIATRPSSGNLVPSGLTAASTTNGTTKEFNPATTIDLLQALGPLLPGLQQSPS